MKQCNTVVVLLTMERYFLKCSYYKDKSQIKFTYFLQILSGAFLLASKFGFNNQMLGIGHKLLPYLKMLGTALLVSYGNFRLFKIDLNTFLS